MYPPAAVNPNLLGRMGSMDNRPTLQYQRRAQSPLGPMLAYIGGAVVGLFVFFAAAAAWIDPDGGDLVYTENGATRLPSVPGQVYLVWFVVYFIVGCLFVWWMSRIGANWGQFGPGVPAAVWFPIWLLVASFIPFVSIVVLIVQIAWPIRLLAQGIVRGGSLPRWLALFGWVPTLTIILSPLSALFWLVIPLTVTIIQHLGIRQDRQVMAAYEAAGGR